MKVKNLKIDSYKHLLNIKFSFTYPEGHLKAGMPLEKICIMGQSATGKTSVLELIRDSLVKLNTIQTVDEEFFFDDFQLHFNGEIAYLYNNEELTLNDKTIIKGDLKIKNSTGRGGAVGRPFSEGIKLIYLSSETISKVAVNIFSQNPLDILKDSSKDNASSRSRQDDSNYFYQFLDEENREIWLLLFYEIHNYRKKFYQFASELLNKGTIGDPGRLSKQYEFWSLNNENPLKPFASQFNPLLEKLHLEVDLVNTEFTVPIKLKNRDEVIPIQKLSTGTKGLLLSMFPLWELDTKEAIILIDEPERSLFPDIQIDLISYYQSLAPDAQIVVATHSPFIAASFEPEERFILYFTETGEVKLRRGISPVGDDPNDILSNDFLVDYINAQGKEAYRNYLSLKAKMREETEPVKKKKLLLELTELGDKYNFYETTT